MAKDVGSKGKGVDKFKKSVKVLFDRANVNKLVHVKPLYLHVKIEGEEIGRVLVDNGTAVNKLPLRKWSTIRITQPSSSMKIKEIEDEICEILTMPLLTKEPGMKMKISPNE
uniref:Retropepsins domain-containing protein n=1 Tax=Populus trichocarpa TaxID=3694 RepID=A0A2K2AHH1_POPTR